MVGVTSRQQIEFEWGYSCYHAHVPHSRGALVGIRPRKGGVVKRVVLLAIAVCLACCALPLTSCKAPTLSDCDLQLFKSAVGTGDTRNIVSGVVSLGGVYRQGDVSGRVICLNIGMSEASASDSISIEPLTDGVRVGKSSGVWEDTASYQLSEIAGGGYVYFAVPVEQGADETADAAAYRSFGNVEFRVTFYGDGDAVSYRYRIVPTGDYLTWVDDPKGNTYDGARFEVTRSEDA